MQYKNIHRIEKFKNIQEPRVEKHIFSRLIQDQIKFKNIKEHSRIFELKNLRTFKNQGWKNTLFQEQFKFKNIQGFQEPVVTFVNKQ